jgi:NAD(P)-dependent dehydrogenase (short-subunit alcohol dehydrogenase family)
MNRLDGKVALVTGGGQGVGLGIARAMAAAGARVALVDRVAERAEQAAAEFGGIGLGGDASVGSTCSSTTPIR